MKKIFIFMIIMSSMIQLTFANEQDKYEQSFEIETSGITYREPTIMNEAGNMYGINYSLTKKFDGYVTKFEYRFSGGFVDYDGSTWGGTPLKINDIPDHMWEARLALGYEFPIFAVSTLTPYSGLGYRYLCDNPQQTSDSGYQRAANYLYCPIGFEISDGGSFGIILEYDSFLWGEQFSYLSDYDIGYDDVANRQRRGYGYRGCIRYSKSFNNIDLELKLFERFWDIEESDHEDLVYYGIVLGEVYEPKNNSTEIGVSLGLRF